MFIFFFEWGEKRGGGLENILGGIRNNDLHFFVHFASTSKSMEERVNSLSYSPFLKKKLYILII